MGTLQTDIIAAAREWIGTPWHDQASLRGVGCDCAGFYQGVIKDVLGLDVALENYSRHRESDDLLDQIRAQTFLSELEDPIMREAGDLLVFRIGLFPGHLGLCNGHGMIHADQSAGRVVEIPDLGTAWRSRLVYAFAVDKNWLSKTND